MKKLISAFLILFISISVFSQPILHDTILEQQGEFCLVRIYADNGYYNDFLIKGAPEEIEVNFFGSEPENTPPSVNDQLEATLWLPDPNGGVMPEDIVYNPVSGKHYIFGNRRLAVVDPQTYETETALTVSEHGYSVGEVSLFYNSFRLAADEQQNLIYCSTYDLEILAIDCNTNQVVQTYSENDLAHLLGTKMLFDPENRRLFWLLVSWDGYSKLKVYDLNAGTSYEKFFDDQVFDMVHRTDGSRIYVSTSQDFITLDCEDLSEYNSYQTTYMRLVYNEDTDEVVGHGSFIVNFFSGETGAFITGINSIFNQSHAGCFAPETESSSLPSKIYFAGSNPNYGGPKILIINGSTHATEAVQNNPISYKTLTLVYQELNHKIFAAGINNVFDIDVATNSYVHSNGLQGCTSFKLINDPINFGNSISIHTYDGNFCKITNECGAINFKVTGMSSYISLLNKNSNEVYFISTDSYGKSPVSIYDATTNEYKTTITSGKRIMSAQYNEIANKLFLACYDDGIIEVIDIGNNYYNYTINLTSYNMMPKTLLSYQDKVYVGAYAWPPPGKIICIDAGTLEWDVIADNLTGAPNNIILDELNGRVFFSFGYEHTAKIISVDISSSGILAEVDLGICPFSVQEKTPISLAYSPINNNLYVGLYHCNELLILDADDLSTVKIVTPGAEKVKYIVYDHYRDLIYASIKKQNGTPSSNITVIDCEINEIVKILPTTYNSFIFHNPANDQVYMHTIQEPGSGQQVEVKTLDCLWNNEISGIGTGNYIDVTSSVDYRLQYSDYAFNAETNKLYVPNLAFSNASVIQCHTDKLQLKGQYTWISFPRMERTDDTPFGSQVVLDHRVEPWAPDYLKLEDKYANWIKYFNEPTPIWVPYGLDEVQSTFGYILEADWGEGTPPKLRLEGAKLDPTWPVQLEGPENNENWLGYFYENPSWYWECIPQWMLNELIIEIKTQYWSMIRTCPPPQGDCWLFDGSVRPFSYGDLVIIRAYLGEGEAETFSWLTGGQGEGGQDRPAPQYFSYTEQADYIPFFVEFDEASEVEEVAVLAGGECKGASTRLPGDTLVEVNAYLEGTPAGATIEFEVYEGYKSSRVKDGSYVVFNPKTRANERRAVYAGEKARYHLVSMKAGENFTVPGTLGETGCRPNPFSGNTTISFRINRAMPVWVEILSPDGRLIKELAGGMHDGGYYEYVWPGTGNNGQNLPSGIYFWRIRTGCGEQAAGKLVKTGN